MEEGDSSSNIQWEVEKEKRKKSHQHDALKSLSNCPQTTYFCLGPKRKRSPSASSYSANSLLAFKGNFWRICPVDLSTCTDTMKEAAL